VRLERKGAVKSLHELDLLNSPEKIVAAGPVELLKKNIGRRGLLIIASLLQECGYIENARLPGTADLHLL
jgi:hypothetical protein